MSEDDANVSYAHVARYRYSSDVFENDNTLRLVPYSDDYQAPIRYEVQTRPPGGQVSYRDRFGNQVYRARVTIKHRELLIVSVGQVMLRPRVFQSTDVPRAVLQTEPELLDFVGPSRFVEPHKLADIAAGIPGVNEWLIESVVQVVDWVHQNIEHRRGYTDVSTPADEVLRLGRGVCQDQTHLAIGLLRSLGIPCRYVGGIRTDTVGETHAWLEFLHPGFGWVAADCTTNKVGDLGVGVLKFATGRDYADAAPIVGTFLSQGEGGVDKVVNRARFDEHVYSIEDAITELLNDGEEDCHDD